MPPKPWPPRSPFDPSVLEVSGFVVDCGARGAAGADADADADGSVDAVASVDGRTPTPRRRLGRRRCARVDRARWRRRRREDDHHRHDPDGQARDDGADAKPVAVAAALLLFGHGWSSRWVDRPGMSKTNARALVLNLSLPAWTVLRRAAINRCAGAPASRRSRDDEVDRVALDVHLPRRGVVATVRGLVPDLPPAVLPQTAGAVVGQRDADVDPRVVEARVRRCRRCRAEVLPVPEQASLTLFRQLLSVV